MLKKRGKRLKAGVHAYNYVASKKTLQHKLKISWRRVKHYLGKIPRNEAIDKRVFNLVGTTTGRLSGKVENYANN